MRIGLIPLDGRPANTRYPAMIAAIAGAELVLPPTELLSSFRTPSRCDALGAWLRDVASSLDAVIVSFEMLGYGGLISSRITDEAADAIIARLSMLRDLKRQHPALPILGFNLITRISNADDATEEAAYWQQYGTRLYRLSALLDQQKQGLPVQTELAALQRDLPPQSVQDFLR